MHEDKHYSILDEELKRKVLCAHDKKYKNEKGTEICAECGELILPFTEL